MRNYDEPNRMREEHYKLQGTVFTSVNDVEAEFLLDSNIQRQVVGAAGTWIQGDFLDISRGIVTLDAKNEKQNKYY
jgi:hypothetical protein